MQDPHIRFHKNRGDKLSDAEEERFLELERRRKARVGDWSEAELEQVTVFSSLPEGRSGESAELYRALLGSGDMDRTITLKQAEKLLCLPEGELEEAASDGCLAVFKKASRLYTSESRLGAYLITQPQMPACDPSVVYRMLFVCGFAAGIRAPKLPS